jgi:hypothetical protein
MTITEAYSIRVILRDWLTEKRIPACLGDGSPVPWKARQSIREHLGNAIQALQGAEVRCSAVTGAEENLRGVLAEIDKAVR